MHLVLRRIRLELHLELLAQGRADLQGVDRVEADALAEQRRTAATFAETAALPGVRLIRHAANRGKGAALKTAFAEILRAFPDAAGVVTADADGQHLPEDIRRVTALAGDRYDYEARMLVAAAKLPQPPVQVPITTVYENGNGTSHYRPLADTFSTQAALIRVIG